MKSLIRDFFAAFVWGFLLPGLALSVLVMIQPFRSREALPADKPVYEPGGIRYPVRLQKENRTREEDLDVYLIGVVLAEMPASFEPEALKAQAVAARTYARKAYETGGKHGDGSVCEDPACCQAYISPEEYLRQGGTEADLEKVIRAVEATSGQVLMYEGELIEATYFSCSGGSTEDALEVWGTDYPYLRAVDSPGEEEATFYRSTVSFAPEAFAEALGIAPEGSPESWFGLTDYTPSGTVRSIRIGTETFTGTELRSRLGLRSAAFTVEVTDGQILLTTKGYGHRVGMSQYGADAMALAGSTFDEILAHYYKGTTLERFGN